MFHVYPVCSRCDDPVHRKKKGCLLTFKRRFSAIRLVWLLVMLLTLQACGSLLQESSASPSSFGTDPAPAASKLPSSPTTQSAPIASLSPVSSPLPSLTEEIRKDILDLVGMVYPLDDSLLVEVERGPLVAGFPCYEVYVGSPNEETTTTMALFAAEPLTHTLYLMDRVTGQYEQVASVPFKPIIDQAMKRILSSPKESSNSEEYLLAHPKEVQTIMDLGDEALPYLISMYDNGERGLRGVLALSLCQRIHTGLNIASSVSPDGRYRLETYGIRIDITAGGIYPANGIRLVEQKTGKTIWLMEPGYYRTTIQWSADGRYAAVYYEARTNGSTIVLDTVAMTPISLPSPSELGEYSDVDVTERSFRSDPYLEASGWLDNAVLQVNFRWVGEKREAVSGWFTYDVTSDAVQVFELDPAGGP